MRPGAVPPSHPSARERAAIVGLVAGRARRARAAESLEELAGLATAAGAVVVLQARQERLQPDPSLFLGRGRVTALAAACHEALIDVVIVDNELTPAQCRNLEHALQCKVIDRTQLILDIFARRARTREGRLQVELAQLRYLLPRLVGAGVELSRLGAGIGTRGPGESKLETDRRRIRQRIGVLGRELEAVRRRRGQLRERRHKASVPGVALVGYTSAGKTTLFNRLTGAHGAVSDALFVTLDPLARQVRLPDGGRFVLSDTVGFIDRLPHALVAAFRATLEEVVEADLLLHVIDVSSRDREQRMGAVRRVLEEVGARDVPVIDVFTKVDLVDGIEIHEIEAAHRGAVSVSALHNRGCKELLEAVASRLALDTRRVSLHFDAASAADQRRIAALYRQARVLRHATVEGRISIEADVPRRALEFFVPPSSMSS